MTTAMEGLFDPNALVKKFLEGPPLVTYPFPNPKFYKGRRKHILVNWMKNGTWEPDLYSNSWWVQKSQLPPWYFITFLNRGATSTPSPAPGRTPSVTGCPRTTCPHMHISTSPFIHEDISNRALIWTDLLWVFGCNRKRSQDKRNWEDSLFEY